MDPLQIVIPMAGAGSRFARVGYEMPKPLIDVAGQPMIRRVIDNLRPSRPHRFVFICQRAHVERYGLASRLETWAPGCSVVTIEGMTEGAACTVLAASDVLKASAPLMIANADQWIDTRIDDYVAAMDVPDGHGRPLDGLIMTMTADDPKWSFVRLNAVGLVEMVVEKRVISNEATVGIYNFRRASTFVESARAMIEADERVNGEFYVAPVYNRAIAAGARVGIVNVGSEGKGMHGLGVPEDLDRFLALGLRLAA